MANRELPQENQAVEPLFTKKKLSNDLLVALAVGCFIGFLAPFGMDRLPVWLSISYWVFTCMVGYFIFTPMVYFGNLTLGNIVTTHWHRVAVSALLASVLMSFAVPVITWLFFSQPIQFSKQFFAVFPKAVVIGGVITFISMVRDYIKAQQQQLSESSEQLEAHQQLLTTTEKAGADKIMQQLPVEKRGELLCLEMSDHYLKVYTDKGHHLILMRFKDALTQLTDYPGLQTHRSWWVATEAVTSVTKENRKVVLQLSNEVSVPVSRTYLEAVKNAGLT
ncbi:LytTR family transcriptional regulator [Thalassotalea sp. M1531]|uniref:LytTR family transcriptional regulator n=1 Tax=Thalassotalea algicola TaxID=2716224 RepID=A0A7Y0Q5F0_9GAMM|nr:LytTR family DNA-binding domain-containing protein [Thalassotalea algicola]NMP30021.1 LytTR family transcriptional regulator [Thalassotalea algicola]